MRRVTLPVLKNPPEVAIFVNLMPLSASAFAAFPPSFLLMIAVISFINEPPCFSIL